MQNIACISFFIEIFNFKICVMVIYFKIHQGWIECVGIADRCDYDLKQHIQHSGQTLTFEQDVIENISFCISIESIISPLQFIKFIFNFNLNLQNSRQI